MKQLLLAFAIAILAIGLCMSVVFSIDKHRPSCNYIINFVKEVDQDDLNTGDVFRIYYRQGDTLYLGYYY